VALLLHVSLRKSLTLDIESLPISFRLVGAIVVVASAFIVANSKKELGLLAGTFLFGLGVLEIALQVAG
jgi:hypothetical protein